MIRSLSRPHRFAVVLAAAVLVAACSGGDEPSSTTGTVDTPTITSLPPPTTEGTPATSNTTSTTPDSSSPSTSTTGGGTDTTLVLPEGPAGEVAALLLEAERIRALAFVSEPRIELLDQAAFNTRTAAAESGVLDERDAAHTLLYRLADRLDSDEDLGPWRSDLASAPEYAWYDAAAETLVVLVREEYGPGARSEIIHEAIHALTDQLYRWSDGVEALADAGDDDRLLALVSLVEGDATYFQLLYTQSLPIEEQQEIAEEYLEPSPLAASIPDWAVADIVFPFEAGFTFVRDLVADGGIAAVDQSYESPPVSSEQILHPRKYQGLESPFALDEEAPTPSGYRPVMEATLGEWGIRLFIEEALSPGILTQTADGWGSDAYWLFESPTGEVAFALVFLGDSETDTEEVTQAFIDLAEDVLNLGEATRSRGGQEYDRNNRPWVFLDREGTGLLVVFASEASAGNQLADALLPPAPQ